MLATDTSNGTTSHLSHDPLFKLTIRITQRYQMFLYSIIRSSSLPASRPRAQLLSWQPSTIADDNCGPESA